MVMSGLLKRSLASWREAHGFGILCIANPTEAHFLVETPGHVRWAGMSEAQLRLQLAARGFSLAGTDDAVQLARAWATTVTGTALSPAPPQTH